MAKYKPPFFFLKKIACDVLITAFGILLSLTKTKKNMFAVLLKLHYLGIVFLDGKILIISINHAQLLLYFVLFIVVVVMIIFVMVVVIFVVVVVVVVSGSIGLSFPGNYFLRVGDSFCM